MIKIIWALTMYEFLKWIGGIILSAIYLHTRATAGKKEIRDSIDKQIIELLEKRNKYVE